MKSEEGHICQAAEFDDIRTEEAVRLIRTGSFYSCKIRLCFGNILCDFQTMSGQCKDVFQILGCVLKAEKYIQKKCIVSFLQ